MYLVWRPNSYRTVNTLHFGRNHHHHHHWHNSPFSAKAFRSFCQLSLFLAPLLQFLSPNFLTSPITPSSHLSFGLPLCLPSTTATRTLLAGLCSSIWITCPAHFNRLIVMYVTISLSLYNVYNSLLYFIFHSSVVITNQIMLCFFFFYWVWTCWVMGFCVLDTYVLWVVYCLPCVVFCWNVHIAVYFRCRTAG